MSAAATSERSPSRSAIVWLEDAGSRICRGQAETLTREGFHVRLAEEPGFAKGDELAVRLALERGGPTFATTARVAWVRPGVASTECALEWSAPPGERKALEAWIAKAA
jgi:hypothetical protein